MNWKLILLIAVSATLGMGIAQFFSGVFSWPSLCFSFLAAFLGGMFISFVHTIGKRK